MLEEFKKFALRGNIIDLAIGVIIGGAFSGLVNSIVNDLLMPVIGLITGGIDFSNMFLQLAGTKQQSLAAAKAAGATIAYGNFITLLINFLIVAWVLFLFVKGVNRMRRKEEENPAPPPPKQISREEELLVEIRDLLAKKQKIDH
ncbi:large conductance mechanosensitive channel protein MscL [Bartonella sp. DGB2]|uniref:large conductance mechanosensitive channel protein MscL n=1 Tax=Bartonella sp. DGB2 TaxID=3388426 RepID=UPI00398F9187